MSRTHGAFAPGFAGSAEAVRSAVCFIAAAAFGLSSAARAAPPAPPPTVAPAEDRLKLAFDRLSEVDRRAVQDALLWTGDFVGVITGTFGPKTRDALTSFARRSGLASEAALDTKSRARLLAAGAQARADVGFAPVNDKAAGVALSLPTKLLPRRTSSEGGTRYASADGAIVVDTLSRPAGEGGLPEIFDRMNGGSGPRKVTYKLLRPDFFVVAGEIGERKFYSRFVLGAAEGQAMVRGITLAYPKAEGGRMDIASLAVAASFDAFPANAPQVPTSAAIAAPPVPPVKPPRPPATFALTAIRIRPGAALTHLPLQPCLTPNVGGAAITLRDKDEASGLAIFDVPRVEGSAPVLRIEPAIDATSLAVLFAREPEGLDIAPAVLRPEEGTSSATFSVSAGIQGRAEGTPLVDPEGRLVGLITEPRRLSPSVAGTRLQNDYPAIGASRLKSFLGSTGGEPTRTDRAPSLSLGAVAALWRPLILRIVCQAAPP